MQEARQHQMALPGFEFGKNVEFSAGNDRSGQTVFLVIFLQVIGEFANAIGDAFEFRVRVAHGHTEVGVAHGLLNDGETFTPASCKRL